MDKKMIISISIDPLPPNADIVEYLREMQKFNVDYIHCDVMDGVFVPQVTYDSTYIKYINDNTVIPLDVHLMIDRPWDYVDNFINAGANIVTLHYETFNSRGLLVKTMNKIRRKGVLVGLAVSPSTEVYAVVDVLSYVDVLLVMCVRPGLSGQEFIDAMLTKLKLFNSLRKQFKFNFKMAVDGGVTKEIIPELKNSGVDIIVSGSYIYNSDDRKRDIRRLRG